MRKSTFEGVLRTEMHTIVGGCRLDNEENASFVVHSTVSEEVTFMV